MFSDAFATRPKPMYERKKTATAVNVPCAWPGANVGVTQVGRIIRRPRTMNTPRIDSLTSTIANSARPTAFVPRRPSTVNARITAAATSPAV
jgi:hypothetical protein